MIGVWDTVGSLGMPTRILERLNPFRSDFHYVALNPDICSAYHALAVDEERKHFLPTLWQEKDVGGEQRLEQVWFVGCHGDVGGQEMGVDHALSDITLLWMMQKAQEQGLAFKPEAINALRPRHDGEIHDSRAVLGRLWPRRVRTIPLAKQTWIHSSVMQRAADTQLNPRYAPSALGQIGEVARLCTIVNS
jgi:hypothetical protein